MQSNIITSISEIYVTYLHIFNSKQLLYNHITTAQSRTDKHYFKFTLTDHSNIAL